jgi:uncharacterized protein YndB with AHSA1/START domain
MMPFAEVRRHVSASAERVFRAFSDRAQVARWLTPGPDVKLSVLAFDFRVGGHYRFAYDVPGVGRMLVGGTYRAIEPPTRIVFSWLIEPPDEHAGIESEVTISIAARRRGAELIVRHEKLGRHDANVRHSAGWQGALEQLAALLSTELARSEDKTIDLLEPTSPRRKT